MMSIAGDNITPSQKLNSKYIRAKYLFNSNAISIKNH